MTTLVTADLHLSSNPRDAYRHERMWEIRKILKKYEVDRLLILGDLTEQKDHHSAELVNEVVNHMILFSECCPVTILRGNHDYVSSECPFFVFLKHIKRIQWINNPTG